MARMNARDLLGSKDRPTLHTRLLHASHDAGFDWFTGMTIQEQLEGKHLEHVYQLPEGYEAVYFDNPIPPGEVCPVVRHVNASDIPLCWGPRMYRGDQWRKDLYNVQSSFGMSSGVELAIHIPGGVHVWLGFQRSCTKWLQLQEQISAASAAVSRCASTMQDDMLRILGGVHPAAVPECVLNEVERSLLAWTLDGMSSAEIQARTRRDLRAIAQQLGNVAFKLGASNKWHAAARAFQAGLIT